jgi:hypothetical protein
LIFDLNLQLWDCIAAPFLHKITNMCIAVSSISFTAATVSQALFDTKSDVASAVGMAFESKTKHDKECSFVTTFKLQGQVADSGILGCSDPDYICVEDDVFSCWSLCSSCRSRP